MVLAFIICPKLIKKSATITIQSTAQMIFAHCVLIRQIPSIKTGNTFPIRIVIIAANAVLVGMDVYFVMCIGILE